MKNLFFLIVISLVSSCSKQDEIAKNNTFESDLLATINKVDLVENVLIITKTNINKTKFIKMNAWEAAWDKQLNLVIDENNHLCTGDGVSFAKSVQKEFDRGTCLVVYKKGSVYFADKANCPS